MPGIGRPIVARRTEIVGTRLENMRKCRRGTLIHRSGPQGLSSTRV